MFCEETEVEIWTKLNKKRADNFIPGHLISIRLLVSLLFFVLVYKSKTTQEVQRKSTLQELNFKLTSVL